MTRILAIDSDRHEMRIVLLDREIGGIRIRHAVTASAGQGDAGGPAVDQVARLLAGESLAKARTVVSVSRDLVQLSLMELPPAPLDELPDMVRFQAEREFTSMGPNTVLDYLPLSGGELDPHRVLAAALAGDGLTAARNTCKSLGAHPAHITVRACAAASLLGRWSQFDRQGVALLAVPLAEQVELIVLADGQPVVMRTVRLPAEEDGSGGEVSASQADQPGSVSDASLQGMMAVGLNRRDATLASEIRRTLAASNQQLGQRSVDVVYIAGGAQSTSARHSLLGRQLRLRCEGFSPEAVLSESGVSGVEELAALAEPGRFAGVLGMALDAAEDQPPAIDFLHPRRPAEKASVQRIHFLAAAAAVVMVAATGWWLYDQLATKTAELADLRADTADLEQSVERFEEFEEQAGEIEAWLASDVNWLDELERLSRQWRPEPLDSDNFESQNDAVLTSLWMKGATRGGEAKGEMTISGAGRSAEVIPALESRLRDETHAVTGKSLGQDESVAEYPLHFDMDVEILPADDDEGGPAE